LENVTTEPLALRRIVESGALEGDPFVLIDIGCALGIDAAWRAFGPYLVARGFDPQVDECARLNAAEANPSIRYHAAFVGLPDDHPFHTSRPAPDERTRGYFEPFSRTSAFRAAERNVTVEHEAAEAVRTTDHWRDQGLSTEKIALSDYAAREGLRGVDFVKIDTDGADLEAAVSCEGAIRPAGILGFLIESAFTGSHHEGENTFHCIDRYMKAQGFLLFGITVNRHSRAALPGRFVYRAPYQTRGGQPIWGDMLYLRDAGSPRYEAVWGSALSATKLLKLVYLFELFELSDCAVEVVLRHRGELATIIDPDPLLDLLTPMLGTKQLSYAEYNAAFDEDIELFFPDDETQAAVPGPRRLTPTFERVFARRRAR
jgi:hypothetical protein